MKFSHKGWSPMKIISAELCSDYELISTTFEVLSAALSELSKHAQAQALNTLTLAELRDFLNAVKILQRDVDIITNYLQAEMGVFKKNVKFPIEEIRKTEPTRWQASPVTIAADVLLRKKN